MHHLDLSRAVWRKSRCSQQNGECVEVTASLPGVVAVRDSKRPDGPKITFTPADWQAFTASVKTGQHDLA